MIIPDGGREYAHWAWEGAPPDAPPPQLLAPTTGAWEPQEWATGTGPAWDRLLNDLHTTPADVTAGAVRISRVLITTPTAYAAPGGDEAGVLFPLGTTLTRVRLVDAPELVIRGAGHITIL